MITVVVIILTTGCLVAAQGSTCSSFCSSLGMLESNPGKSCDDIYQINKATRGVSGDYWIQTPTGVHKVYCDMELDCGGTKGGWMRIADIDTKRGDQCPNGWVKSSQHHSCKANHIAAGCYSTIFDTMSTMYGKVCGKIIGYQKGSMDAFYPSARAHGKYPNFYTPDTMSRSLDGVYVNGISITLGYPRKHVWTYAIGLSDDYDYPAYNCPCAKTPGPDPPSFVHDHYYCESGNTGTYDVNELYTEDPLWDGAGCLPENSCCYQPSMLWFYRQFPKAETGNIEVRICRDYPSKMKMSQWNSLKYMCNNYNHSIH